MLSTGTEGESCIGKSGVIVSCDRVKFNTLQIFFATRLSMRAR